MAFGRCPHGLVVDFQFLRVAGVELEELLPKQALACVGAGPYRFEQFRPAPPSDSSRLKYDSGPIRARHVAAQKISNGAQRKMPRARLGENAERTQSAHEATERRRVGPRHARELKPIEGPLDKWSATRSCAATKSACDTRRPLASLRSIAAPSAGDCFAMSSVALQSERMQSLLGLEAGGFHDRPHRSKLRVGTFSALGRCTGRQISHRLDLRLHRRRVRRRDDHFLQAPNDASGVPAGA